MTPRALPAAMPAKKAGKPSKRAATTKAPAAPRKSAKKPAQAKGGKASAAGKPITKTAPKAEGEAALKAYLGALPAWQGPIFRRVDAVITREVPGVVKAIKWHSPIYGVAGQGWFASVGGFKSYVKVNFFDGAKLQPLPPGGEGKTMRYWDLPTVEDLDERQLADWVRQAAKLPGWGTV